jgi:hypothetical protein
VPLVLETAAPTFRIGIPMFPPWNLSIYRPNALVAKSSSSTYRVRASATIRRALPKSAPSPPPMQVNGGTAEESVPDIALAHRQLSVSSRGNVSTTFQVPGMISIPSDGVVHNVTIVQLELDASMSWVCIPKQDTKVHLKVCSFLQLLYSDC